MMPLAAPVMTMKPALAICWQNAAAAWHAGWSRGSRAEPKTVTFRRWR
jgi:hypothetical protein